MSVSRQMSEAGHTVQREFEKETQRRRQREAIVWKEGTIYTVILRFTSKVLHLPDIT